MKCRETGYGTSVFKTPSALISQTSSVFTLQCMGGFLGGLGNCPTTQLFTRNSAVIDSGILLFSIPALARIIQSFRTKTWEYI